MVTEDVVGIAAGSGGVLWVLYKAWKMVLADMRDIHAAKEAETSYDLAIAALKKIIAEQADSIKSLQVELDRVRTNSISHIDARYRLERQMAELREEVEALRSANGVLVPARKS